MKRFRYGFDTKTVFYVSCRFSDILQAREIVVSSISAIYFSFGLSWHFKVITYLILVIYLRIYLAL